MIRGKFSSRSKVRVSRGLAGAACGGQQRGQALTEFLVIAVAVLPLLLLMPVLARYQEISHATQMASRYVAFDAAVRNGDMGRSKPESQLADEVRRRFFSRADAPVFTHDAVLDTAEQRNPFWRDPKGRSLIESFARDVSVSFGPDRGASHAEAFTAALDGTLFLSHESLALPARGIYNAQVAVKLINLPDDLAFYKPFGSINWHVERGTSVLVNGWAAKDAQQVESKIAGSDAVFPAGLLADAGAMAQGVVTAIDYPGGVTAPKLGQLEFWRDVVPADRLHAQGDSR